MRAKWTMLWTLAAAAALLAMPAIAQETEDAQDFDDASDRVLVHSYDPVSMQLLWADMAGDAEVEEECGIEADKSYTVDIEGDDVTITDEGDTVQSEDCTFNVTDVEGPEGQVNHGTVVSNFVHDLKDYLEEEGREGGIGCYVRVIAQSDYGKGDQQVRVSDPEGETPSDADIQFEFSETTCNGPGGDEEEATSSSGRPDWAGEQGPPAFVQEKLEGKGGPPASKGGQPAGKGGPPGKARGGK